MSAEGRDQTHALQQAILSIKSSAPEQRSGHGQAKGGRLLSETEIVLNLCGHQHADVVVLVEVGDLALELAGSFGSHDWIGEAVKLGHEAPALAIQISIRDRHVEFSLGRLPAASLDYDLGISASTAIAVHDHPFADLDERRVKGMLI
jgi:hypothetical protein